MDPITYPVVTVGGEKYTVKFSLLAQYVLDSMGVDVRKLPQIFASDQPGKIATFMKLFSACVAHQFESKGLPVPSPEYWAARVTPEEWKQICPAVVDSLLKVPQAGEVRLQEPAATKSLQ